MTESESKTHLWGASDRIELIATIILAIATILTAWSGFQSGKWSGQQAISFSEAGASRTESARADTRGGQLVQLDAAMYIDWVTAISDDLGSGAITKASLDPYAPTDDTVSGFLYRRLREEFAPAVDAWLATDPLDDDSAPRSPFDMDEYVVDSLLEADRLLDVAEEKAADARTANQNGDNYVLTMVLFASVLFFAGVSSKMIRPRNRILMLGIGIFTLVAGLVILASLPILL